MKLEVEVVQRAGQEKVSQDGLSKRVFLKDVIYVYIEAKIPWGRVDIYQGDAEGALKALRELRSEAAEAILKLQE